MFFVKINLTLFTYKKVRVKIRLLFSVRYTIGQSDQGLQCLHFPLLLLEEFDYGKANLIKVEMLGFFWFQKF